MRHADNQVIAGGTLPASCLCQALTPADAFSVGTGPVVMVWGWVCTGSLHLLAGLAMSELCSAFPVSGGLYFWSFMLSEKYGLFASWIAGWLNLLGKYTSLLHAVKVCRPANPTNSRTLLSQLHTSCELHSDAEPTCFTASHAHFAVALEAGRTLRCLCLMHDDQLLFQQ